MTAKTNVAVDDAAERLDMNKIRTVGRFVLYNVDVDCDDASESFDSTDQRLLITTRETSGLHCLKRVCKTHHVITQSETSLSQAV